MPRPPWHAHVAPEHLRILEKEAAARGHADIVRLSGWICDRLDEWGYDISVGKSAVGEWTKALKERDAALRFSQGLLSELNIEEESDLYRTTAHMLSVNAVNLMAAVTGDDEKALDPKDLRELSVMLKNVASSAGLREKLLADERERIAKEAREAAQAEMAQALEATATEAGMSAEMLDRVRRGVLGLRA